MNQSLPLIALHLQRMRVNAQVDDFVFDDLRASNMSPNGELAFSRASKPYTSALTPGHSLKSGYTPSGKFKPAKFVASKMDKRAGK